jgi:diaminopimelate epimerase
MKFRKMEGIGNDMIMIDNLDGSISLDQKTIVSLCSRRFGIGADGLILLEKGSGEADCFMNYYNADGSIGEMCGNGIRCTAKFFIELTGFKGEVLNVDTRDGLKPIRIINGQYEVNMGPARFNAPSQIPDKVVTLAGFDFHSVSMGNPHTVTVVDNVEEIDLAKVGPLIENDLENFPEKVNVEFVEVVREGNDSDLNNPRRARDKIALKMRVWERGSGITLACGTGACAVYVVAQKLGLVSGETKVMLPGGDLYIREENGAIMMRGPAENVFDGKIL